MSGRQVSPYAHMEVENPEAPPSDELVQARSFKLHSLPKAVKDKLAAFDRDNDGDIDEKELIQALEDLTRTRSENRMIRTIMLGLVVLLILLVGSLTFMTYTVVQQAKDTEMNGQVLTVKGTDDPAQCASTPDDMAQLTSASLQAPSASERRRLQARLPCCGGGGIPNCKALVDDLKKKGYDSFVGNFMTVADFTSVMSRIMSKAPRTISMEIPSTNKVVLTEFTVTDYDYTVLALGSYQYTVVPTQPTYAGEAYVVVLPTGCAVLRVKPGLQSSASMVPNSDFATTCNAVILRAPTQKGGKSRRRLSDEDRSIVINDEGTQSSLTITCDEAARIFGEPTSSMNNNRIPLPFTYAGEPAVLAVKALRQLPATLTAEVDVIVPYYMTELDAVPATLTCAVDPNDLENCSACVLTSDYVGAELAA